VKWRLALVEKLNTGNDGLVRSACIKTSTGRTSRPIVKLYPLEVNSNLVESGETDLDLPDTTVKDTRVNRPVRNAAIKARQRLKDWAAQI
jgi:hypothetical protein